MNITLDTALTDGIAQLVREIEATEAARVPVETEVADALLKLDLISARAETSSSLWPTPSPSFSTTAFNDGVLAGLMMIEPKKTREAIATRARLRAEAWQGLRLAPTEKGRRLAQLQTDLRTARAKLEQARRAIEARTGEVLPRVGDDPGVWLLPPDALDALAATAGNGRQR